jgi:plasmid stabilization system protein ParE
MPKQIIWSPSAEGDFGNILEYLNQKWGEKVACQFIEITSTILLKISLKPKMFPLSNKKMKIRRCVVTKHNSIYYRESVTQIQILRIYDTRQDPDKLTFKR